MRSRVDRLSSAAKEVVRTAAVLGPEFDLGLLTAACGKGEALGSVLAEVCAKGLLQDVADELEPRYRFRHALVQEAIYRGLMRNERRYLHGRAAWALEAISAGRLDEVAAVVGRHFAAASEAEPAVHYLNVAGENAVNAFANDEAISAFNSALKIVHEQPLGGEAMVWAGASISAKLADVLWRIGRRGEAREVLHDAIRFTEPAGGLAGARLQALLGRLECDDRCHDAALAAFDAAEALLGERPWDQGDATADVWLEVMVDGRAVVHLQTKEPALALAALSAARPRSKPRAATS